MIRRAAQAFVAVMAILLLCAKIQRSEDDLAKKEAAAQLAGLLR